MFLVWSSVSIFSVSELLSNRLRYGFLLSPSWLLIAFWYSMSYWLWWSFKFSPPVSNIRGVLPSPDLQIKAFQSMTLSVRSSSILIHLLPPKAKAALTWTRPELKVRKDLWMDCSGRHRVRLYSYRYLKLAPRSGAYWVELRRSECHLLCWSQYLSVVGNYPRQTASRDQHSRKIHRPLCSVAGCRITGSNAQFEAG